MNVIPIPETTAPPSAFTVARSGDDSDQASGTRIAFTSATGTLETRTPETRKGATNSATGKTDPLTGRYTTVAFRYDAEAARLVMLFRNPANGATVDQIPTATALKQYKEAQRLQERGQGASTGRAPVDATDGRAGAAASGWERTAGMRSATSDRSSFVVSSFRASFAGLSIMSGAAGVNLVI